MFEGLSLIHILLFSVILLLLFGAKRLPEIGGALGKSIGEFKKSMRDIQNVASAPPPAADGRRIEGPEPVRPVAWQLPAPPPEEVRRSN